MQWNRESAMSTAHSHALGVTVYHYNTFVPQGEKIVPVRSARPATLELIEALAAEPLPGTGRVAHPSEICDLGFFRGPMHVAHGQRPN